MYRYLRALVLTTALFAGAHTQAVDLKVTGSRMMGLFYVTSAYCNSGLKRTGYPKNALYQIYINWSPKRFDPTEDQRVTLFTDTCSDLTSAALAGKHLALELKPNSAFPNWDLEIANYSSAEQLLNGPQNPMPSLPPIEFTGEPSNPADEVVHITNSITLPYTVRALDPSGWVRFAVDLTGDLLFYTNSAGELEFTQLLSSSEKEHFVAAVRKAQDCPVDITISRDLHRVTKASSKCVDLPNINLNSNAG